MKAWVLGVAAAVTATIAAPAAAQNYTMDITVNGVAGTFDFHVNGDASAGFAEIDTLSGLFGGDVMSLLAPGSFPSKQPNDNLFTETFPYLSFNGLSFSAGGHSYNIYSDEGSYLGCSDTAYSNANLLCIQSATVSLRTGAVPEPATWAMMIGGFASVGFALRRSRRKRQQLA